MARDLRTELYAHLQTLSLSFYSSKQTGSIISRVSNDSDRLWDFIALGVIEVTISIIMLLGLGGVLLWMDWRLGLIMTLPVPLIIFSFRVHGRTLRKYFLRVWRKWSLMTAVLSDTIPGMRVVKAFNQEDREVERFNKRNEDVLVETNTVHTIWTRFWPLLVLGLNAMNVGVWIFALPRLLSAEAAAGHLTLGTFMAFMLYMGMFMMPIETLGMMTRMMNRATSSAIRIFEILDTRPEIRNVSQAVCLSPVEGRVTFEDVTFAYDGVRQVLRGVNFNVEPGEMIGLAGPSGSGKTTVTNLIARFYDTLSGRVLIDGVDLRELDVGHYRRQIGMVLQDPHLFHGTILANIRYGVPEASIAQVIEAARAANAHDFVCRLPHGYDTIVGERGHTLSGGERQRVSIARAILSNPRILILDEATSSVDTETEYKIQEALDRLVAGRTVFAIAHRLSTLRHASRLFVFDDGRLTEEGTHAELLALEDGTYRKLNEMQRELHEMYAV
ncbi:ABC transporter ATP-binding protein [Candidatus Sumerlaeota bacterium]